MIGEPENVWILPGGGGGTHIFGRTGMCRSNGSLFYEKKSLNMGQLFWLSPNFWVFTKNCENGYPFLPKSPLKMGRGFEAQVAHPCPTQIWVPPGEFYWKLKLWVCSCLFCTRALHMASHNTVISIKNLISEASHIRQFVNQYPKQINTWVVSLILPIIC